jgi:hypothetical protein
VEQDRDPDMKPHSYAHLIFDKGAKKIQWRKPLQQMFLGKVMETVKTSYYSKMD